MCRNSTSSPTRRQALTTKDLVGFGVVSLGCGEIARAPSPGATVTGSGKSSDVGAGNQT